MKEVAMALTTFASVFALYFFVGCGCKYVVKKKKEKAQGRGGCEL